MLTWEQAVSWARAEPSMQDLVRVCYYDDPIEQAAQRFYESEEWPAIRQLLQFNSGDKVLEVGAGRGLVCWAFAREGCQVTALEPDPSSLIGAGAIRQLMQATGVKFEIAEQWGESLPFDDNLFDHIVCRAVLHHAHELPTMCRQIYRVLKPGGKFLAIKEHIADTPAELDEFLKSHPLHHLYGGEHAFQQSEYLAAFTGAGFANIQQFLQFDHPISWSPQFTLERLRYQMANALQRRIGSWLANKLSQSNQLVRRYGRWLSHRNRAGGRLVSYLATKPV